MTTDKDKVIALLNAKKVSWSDAGGSADDISLNDGSYGKVCFDHNGKFVGVTRTVKAALTKHINKAVY